jgi:hypothetical protein
MSADTLRSNIYNELTGISRVLPDVDALLINISDVWSRIPAEKRPDGDLCVQLEEWVSDLAESARIFHGTVSQLSATYSKYSGTTGAGCTIDNQGQKAFECQDREMVDRVFQPLYQDLKSAVDTALTQYATHPGSMDQHKALCTATRPSIQEIIQIGTDLRSLTMSYEAESKRWYIII